MFGTKSLIPKAAFVITLMFAVSTTAVIAQEHRLTDQEIARRLPLGTRFSCNTFSSAGGILEIRPGRLRSNVTDPTITIGRQQITIPFTGTYYHNDIHQELNNVDGVITIVRWSTGAAITISFTVHIAIPLPRGRIRMTGEIRSFDGAIQLGSVGELAVMAGSFTLNTPRVIDPFGNAEPRPGPFPFFAREIR